MPGQLARDGGSDGTGPLGAFIHIVEGDVSRLDPDDPADADELGALLQLLEEGSEIIDDLT